MHSQELLFHKTTPFFRWCRESAEVEKCDITCKVRSRWSTRAIASAIPTAFFSRLLQPSRQVSSTSKV
ncbi:hypothetical protein C7B80_33880 [Cyanosarcina cf. burmensis CCALA 770]|nr:hypothetical protein C7B80_33880 [Cyanosarcina cf. burmensis CCALA 770]